MDTGYILNKFGINEMPISINKLTSGNINSTFLAEFKNRKIVIQSLNRNVFKNCYDVMNNISIVNEIFDKYQKNDVAAVKFHTALSGVNYIEHEESMYRICDYISEDNSDNALFLTGFAYGKFIKIINTNSDNIKKFRNTISDFHNYSSYLQRLINNPDSSMISRIILSRLSSLENVLSTTFDSDLKRRITHNDAKADNVIIGSTVTVIDLDTVMEGYVAIDYGDTIRSFTADNLSFDIIQSITEGYAKGLDGLLDTREIASLYYGILYVTAELAVRYFSDYIGSTDYFKTKTPSMCQIRAQQLINQLDFFLKYEGIIKRIINNSFQNGSK